MFRLAIEPQALSPFSKGQSRGGGENEPQLNRGVPVCRWCKPYSRYAPLLLLQLAVPSGCIAEYLGMERFNFTLILVPLGSHYVANRDDADQLALVHQG